VHVDVCGDLMAQMGTMDVHWRCCCIQALHVSSLALLRLLVLLYIILCLCFVFFKT
jgi:hypothetical protein